MKRKIIKINEEKCNGCGLCAEACHEGAISMVNGKAKLLRDDYCDGLGDCLPVCPTAAISFEEREAAAYNEDAVKINLKKIDNSSFSGCPGSQIRTMKNKPDTKPTAKQDFSSQLRQWPVQIKLVPARAPFFENASLLIAADCAAYSYGNFHEDFMKDQITIIGCPKLDENDYSKKLAEILKHNNIKNVMVARMEVPCCGGLANAAIEALKQCEKMIPWQIITITTDGQILKQ